MILQQLTCFVLRFQRTFTNFKMAAARRFGSRCTVTLVTLKQDLTTLTQSTSSPALPASSALYANNANFFLLNSKVDQLMCLVSFSLQGYDKEKNDLTFTPESDSYYRLTDLLMDRSPKFADLIGKQVRPFHVIRPRDMYV